MRKFYALLFIILSSLHVSAQKVYGIITDAQTKEPLLFVNIVGQNRTGTTSLSDGSYALEQTAGELKLTFSYIGYQTETFTVQLREGEDYKLDVVLIEQKNTLETVVLSAGKFEQRVEETTVSIEVIKPTLIDEKNTVKLQEAFQQTPGVNIVNDQVNIRSGSGWSFGAGSRVLMMVDDIPMMSPDAGQVQWKLLPNESVYQMEVIKGASSALFGTSALNGLINVRTVFPTTEPQTTVSVFGGWYDSPKRKEIKWWDSPQLIGGATFMHARKIKNADLVFSGNWLNDEGFRYQEIDKRARLNVKMKFYPTKIKGMTWGFSTSALYSKSGDAMLWEDYETQAYIARDSAITLTDGWDYYVDPFVNLNHGRSKHSLRGRFLGINNNAKSPTTNYENFSDYYYGEYQFQHFFEKKLTLTIGGVAAFANSDSEVFQGVHNTKNLAAYGQLDKKWDRLTASFGIRYEDYRVDELVYNRPVIRTGVTYQAAKATFVRASYGGGYRYPSMAELFTSTNVGSINVFPNESLKAESGWSGEIGIKQILKIGDDWKGIIDVAGYINSYDNMTEFTFFSWPDGFGFKSVNVGETQVTGFETTLSGTGKIGNVDLRFLTGYAYMNPIVKNPNEEYAEGAQGVEITYAGTSSDNSNNILKYRYQHLFKFDLQTEFKRIGLGVSCKYNDFMQNVDFIFVDENLGPLIAGGIQESREAHPNGDLIFDMRAFYNFNESLRVSFIVDNLTNTEYSPRPALLGAPRMFTFKATYKMN
jgi:iron complex outermembrane receptor protein